MPSSNTTGKARNDIMVPNQLSACFVNEMRNNSGRQTSNCNMMNSAPSDSVLLGVAKALVNIGDTTNNFNSTRLNTCSKKVKDTCKLPDPSILTGHSDKICHDVQSITFPFQSPEVNDSASFPLKLMEVLSNDDHKDTISWLAHGKGFMIFQTKEFVANVMPMYFKQTKFPSFTRKLSRWGFNRVQRGPEVGVYYHDLFNRDKPRLCRHMRSLRGREGKMLKHDSEGSSIKLEKQDESVCSFPHNSSSHFEEIARPELTGNVFPQKKVEAALCEDTFNKRFCMQQGQTPCLKEAIKCNSHISEHYNRTPPRIQGVNISEELVSSLRLNLSPQNKLTINGRSAAPYYTSADEHRISHPTPQLLDLSKNMTSHDQIKCLLLETIIRNRDSNQQMCPHSALYSNLMHASSIRPHQPRDNLVQSVLRQIGLNSKVLF